MKQTVVIKEEDWKDSPYRTREWEESVEIITWEHDYEKKQYVIVFKNKS